MKRLKSFGHSIRRFAGLFSVTLALTYPGVAQAQGLALVAYMPSAAVWVTMASINSLCVSITYDKNGNRVSQTVENMTTATTVWGSSAYGCFVWKP